MVFNSLKQSISCTFVLGTRGETKLYSQPKRQRLSTRMKISSLESCQDNRADIPALMKNGLWRYGFTAPFLYSTWKIAPVLDPPWYCAGELDQSELRTPQMEATPLLPNPICSWRFLSRHWSGPIFFWLRNLQEAHPRHVLAQPVRQTSQRVSARPGQ